MKYSKNTIQNLTKSLFKAGGKVKTTKNVTVKYQKGGDTDDKELKKLQKEVDKTNKKFHKLYDRSVKVREKRDNAEGNKKERLQKRYDKLSDKSTEALYTLYDVRDKQKNATATGEEKKQYLKDNEKVEPQITEGPKLELTPIESRYGFKTVESSPIKFEPIAPKKIEVKAVVEPAIEKQVSKSELTFGQAFAKARREGLKVFEWNGNKYNTDIKIDKDAQGYVYEKDVKGNEFAVKDGKKQPLKKSSVEVGEPFGPNTYTYDRENDYWTNPLDNIIVDSKGLYRFDGFRDVKTYPFTSKKQPVKTIRVTPKKKP